MHFVTIHITQSLESFSTQKVPEPNTEVNPTPAESPKTDPRDLNQTESQTN